MLLRRNQVSDHSEWFIQSSSEFIGEENEKGNGSRFPRKSKLTAKVEIHMEEPVRSCARQFKSPKSLKRELLRDRS